MMMCKCTAEIVWEWKEQCFAAKYVWEFMSFCESCWERFCDWSCWRCESCWGSVIEVAESQKLLKVWELLRFCDWSCWRCESCVQSKYSLHLRVVWEFLFVSLIFIEYVPKQTKLVQKGLREVFVACASLIYSLNMSQNRQSIWHDYCQKHRALKLEPLRLGFTFSKLSLRDSSLKRSGIHVASTWNSSFWDLSST